MHDIAPTAEEAVGAIEEVSAVTIDQAESTMEIADVVADNQDKTGTVAEEISEIAAPAEESITAGRRDRCGSPTSLAAVRTNCPTEPFYPVTMAREVAYQRNQ